MTIQIGDKLPSVILQYMHEKNVTDIDSTEIFSRKKVLLFAVPGAFTPTCSAAHLPGYVVKADEIFARGIDNIVCLSVNDAYVMAAWGEQQNVEDQIRMIADGSAHFTRAIGLELDLDQHGLGIRSQRYAMLVNDGVVEVLEIEASGKFEVSGADSMLTQI